MEAAQNPPDSMEQGIDPSSFGFGPLSDQPNPPDPTDTSDSGTTDDSQKRTDEEGNITEKIETTETNTPKSKKKRDSSSVASKTTADVGKKRRRIIEDEGGESDNAVDSPSADEEYRQHRAAEESALAERAPVSGKNREYHEDDDPDVLWKATINQPKTFTHMISVMKDTDVQLTFTTKATREFTGIMIEVMSDDKTWVAIAQFSCGVVIPRGKQYTWAVSPKTFLATMHLISDDSMLCISQFAGGEDERIYMSAYENNSLLETTGVKLKTEEPRPLEHTLNPMTHTYQIELRLELIKEFVKFGAKIKADDIEFTILEPKGQDEVLSEGIQKTGRKHLYVQLYTESLEVSAMKIFHSTTEWQTDRPETYVVKALEEDNNITEDTIENLEKKFDAKFNRAIFESFIKSMNSDFIDIRLGEDSETKEKLPLILTYSLGTKNSFVKFVLGTKKEE
jgi:hypothetical protein